MEPVVLDWLFALGQGIFIASFFYFLYLGSMGADRIDRKRQSALAVSQINRV
jgi:arginine exporter protein ArgO